MRIYFLLVFILLLTACGNQTIRPDKTDYMGLEQAQNFYLQQNFSQAASAYENLFKLYHKPEFAIYAADAWLQLGDYDKHCSHTK